MFSPAPLSSEPPPHTQETRQTQTREQEAQQALTTTRVAPGVAVGLLVAFVLTLASVALAQWMKTGSLTNAAPAHSLTAPALKEYAQTLQSQSVVAQKLLPATQAFLARPGGVGNEQAYIGRNGWLYYRPDVEYVTGPGFLDAAVLQRRHRAADTAVPVQPDPFPALLALKRDLAARDIRLVVMPVPVKPVLESAQLTPSLATTHGSLQNPSYAAFCAALAAQGIAVCDVSEALQAARAQTGQPQYLRADTHWTPAAAERAAQALAGFMQAFLPPARSAGYVRSTAQAVGTGDIATMLRLPPGQTLCPPQSVTVHPVWTVRHTPWQPDENADVLLLGDSFSNVYSRPDLGWGAAAGLAEQLSFTLQRPVDRIALNAGGSFAARQELADELARGQDRLRGKRLVIYEFAMRDLSGGDWKTLPLPAAGSAVPAPSRLARLAADPGGIRVLGTVQAIAPSPRPGSTPYPDCILAVRLTHLQTQSRGQPLENALVYLWGMRGNHLTPASSYAVGQKVAVHLVPWETMEGQLGGFQRQDLEDEQAHEPLYWSDDSSSSGAAPRMQVSPKHALPLPPPAPLSMPQDALSRSPEIKAFLQDIAAQTARAVQQKKEVIKGRDNWLFYMPELRSQSAGQFWGPDAARASQALKPQYADPLPAILDFKRQLDRAGIELILVPAPAKAAIYPEKTSSALHLRPGQQPPRVDVFDRAFYRTLRAHGVSVLDLTPLFLAHRHEGGRLLYYKQDTHWSVNGAVLAAQAIAQQIGHPAWLAAVAKHPYQAPLQTQLYTADLWKMLGDPSFPTETVTEPVITETDTAGFWPFRRSVQKPVEDWPDSPVVLLGDSYCMGLRAAFAQQMGFPGDMVATAGSGGENARIRLARRGDLKRSKKVVVWCFSVREFTEELGWRTWPIVDR